MGGKFMWREERWEEERLIEQEGSLRGREAIIRASSWGGGEVDREALC